MLAFWESILITTLINAMLALGFYAVLTSGLLSIGNAAIAGLGGYTAAVLTTRLDWPFSGALLVAAVVGGVLGTVLALVTARMNLLVSSLVTLGFGETMSIIAFNIDYIGGANSFTGIPSYTDLRVAAACLAIVLYVVWRYEASRLGLAARAVRDDPRAAAASGISVLRTRALAFGLGGAIAGFAGAVSAHYTLVVNPSDLGFAQSFFIQVYVIFGGSYTMWGGVLGAFLLTALPQSLRFANEFRFALYGLAIVLVIILRPQGLLMRIPLGHRSRLSTALRRKRATPAGPEAA